MQAIVRAGEEHYMLISELASKAFVESHGSSAKEEDIHTYVNRNYNPETLKSELLDQNNIYHIIYYNNKAAGYSKIILNSPYANAHKNNLTKFERIYLLKEFYNLKLGASLFNFNTDLMKQNNQQAVWLYVWKENKKAIDFYQYNNFKIIGSHDFKISATHSNPNHLMLLEF